MKLDWSRKDMERRLKELEDSKKRDLSTKLNLYFYRNVLSNQQIEKVETKYKEQTTEELLNIIKVNTKNFLDLFCKLPQDIRISILTMEDLLKRMYADVDEEKIKKQNLSNQRLFDISYNIYGKISPYFTRVLDYIYKNNLVKAGNSDIYESCCFNESKNNLGYVYMCKNPTDRVMSHESTYNHELMHSILATINPYFHRFPHLEETHSIYIGLKTDKILYEETKDPIYLKSEYNYMVYLQRILLDFSIIKDVSFCKKSITLPNIISAYQDVTGYIAIDEEQEESILNYCSSINLSESFGYLLSGICALHLLDQDEELQRRKFIDCSFNPFRTDKEFLKFIGMDLRDPYYMCDVFNKAGCDIKSRIRKLK